MITRSYLTLFVSLALTASSSAFTIQWNSASNKVTNLQNAAGNATGGLNFGIVVDTLGNGFTGSGLNYDGFTIPASGSYVSLAAGDGSTSDDIFYWNGTTTLATISGTDGGSNGLPTTFALTGITVGSTAGVTASDPFALIWFDTSSTADGAKYGFFTHPSFLIGNQPDTTNFSAAFAGADPTRLASNILGVPEPSRLILAGFGIAALIFRRRRMI